MDTTDGIDAEKGILCVNAIFLRSDWKTIVPVRQMPDCEGTGGNPAKSFRIFGRRRHGRQTGCKSEMGDHEGEK